MVYNLKLKDIAPFGLRIPPELKEQLRVSAKASRRSMNSEVNHLIELGLASSLALRPSRPSFDGQPTLNHASASDLLEHCDPRDLVELVCRLVPLLNRDKVLEKIKAEKPKANASIEGTPEL